MPGDGSAGPLLIRADGGAQVGAGHVMRCLALAEAWRDAGGEVRFLTTGGLPEARVRGAGIGFTTLAHAHPRPEDLEAVLAAMEVVPGTPWLVLDGYHFDRDYQQAIRERGHRLLVIDDTAEVAAPAADVVLNQNLHARDLPYRLAPDTTFLAGTSYTLLRREFLARRRPEPRPADVATRVLVTLGASDVAATTPRVLRALGRVALPGLQVRVVAGASNPRRAELRASLVALPYAVELIENPPDMGELLAWADLAVSAAGSTTWELALLGVPAVLIATAENQRAVADSMVACGAAESAGDAHSIDEEALAAQVAALAHDPERRGRLAHAARLLVDGQGPARVVAVLRAHGQRPQAAELALRAAGPDDAALVWYWANDPGARAVSFQKAPIPWRNHLDWYRSKLESPTCRLWLLEWRGTPVGSIRYDRRGETAVISFGVAPAFRGRGIGTWLLRLSPTRACREFGVGAVEGVTFLDNAASSGAFLKAGFEELSRRTVEGRECRAFRWSDAEAK